MNLKSLAKDTALYGLSSIVGRFLNYLLVPVYTYYIAAESGGYGIVTNLYAYTALLLTLLTFGMETTLFRFGGKKEEDGSMVYSTTLRMVGLVALVFLAAVLGFLHPIARGLGYAAHPEYIACMALIVAQDAFQAIMFSRLRQQGRPVRFVALKFAFIIPNVMLTLFLFIGLPKFFPAHPGLEALWQRFNYGVGFIFFLNLLCTTVVTLLFLPEIKGLFYGWDRKLAGRMLRYTWPLLLLGVVGILNQVADKILFPKLIPGEEGMVQLGIYGACVKIALLMSVLTQAFRYAYEPIVFAGGRSKDNPDTLRDGMKYFVIFALLAFLAVMFYMPLLRYLVTNSAYWEGLKVVPIVMMAEVFMGIYFNLSFWYKLTDQTIWGAIMSAAGVAVMIAVNVAFVPRFGYMACAWGGFAGYGVAMLLSFFIGQKKAPVAYDLRSFFTAFGLTAVLYAASVLLGRVLGVGYATPLSWKTIAFMGGNTVLLAVYGLWVLKGLRRRPAAASAPAASGAGSAAAASGSGSASASPAAEPASSER